MMTSPRRLCATVRALGLCAALSVAGTQAAGAAESDAGPPAEAALTPLLLQVEGMTCAGCVSSTRAALSTVSGVGSVAASFDLGQACVEQDGPVDRGALSSAISGVGFRLVSIEEVAVCPRAMKSDLPDPWSHRGEGFDVATISNGEEVDLKAHLVAGKYTIFDFGAPWCAPCHDAAERLDGYLKDHGDVAVRAVNLDGQVPSDSYAQPVVAQHLSYVKGVPWFLAHAPSGKLIYKGMEVERLVAAVDRHRARQQGRSR